MQKDAPFRNLSEADYHLGRILRVQEDEFEIDALYNFVSILDASRFVEFQSVLIGINERQLGRTALTLALLDTAVSHEPFTTLNATSNDGILIPNNVRVVSHRYGNIGYISEGYLTRGTSGEPSEALTAPLYLTEQSFLTDTQQGREVPTLGY